MKCPKTVKTFTNSTINVGKTEQDNNEVSSKTRIFKRRYKRYGQEKQ